MLYECVYQHETILRGAHRHPHPARLLQVVVQLITDDSELARARIRRMFALAGARVHRAPNLMGRGHNENLCSPTNGQPVCQQTVMMLVFGWRLAIKQWPKLEREFCAQTRANCLQLFRATMMTVSIEDDDGGETEPDRNKYVP